MCILHRNKNLNAFQIGLYFSTLCGEDHTDHTTFQKPLPLQTKFRCHIGIIIILISWPIIVRIIRVIRVIPVFKVRRTSATNKHIPVSASVLTLATKFFPILTTKLFTHSFWNRQSLIVVTIVSQNSNQTMANALDQTNILRSYQFQKPQV